MKILAIIYLLTISSNLIAQSKIVGSYQNYFGSQIQINPDSTFKYTWHFDLNYSWTRGTWSLKGDTVYLNIVPVYDTLQYTKDNGAIKDSLILSLDGIPKRILPQPNDSAVLYSGGQNIMPPPNKLVFKRNRLYSVKNGKLVRKKERRLWVKGKWIPWYFKGRTYYTGERLYK